MEKQCVNRYGAWVGREAESAAAEAEAASRCRLRARENVSGFPSSRLGRLSWLNTSSTGETGETVEEDETEGETEGEDLCWRVQPCPILVD